MSFKMEKEPSVKRNYIFNLLSEIVTLLVPLLTTPYLSRVLHEEGIGKYSFSSSIATYFVLLGIFGFGQYSQRYIAKIRNDNHLCSVAFWELFIAKLITTVISSFLYLILIFSGALANYTVLLYVSFILLLDCAFNIIGYFRAIENFKSVCLRNIFVKIICLILIFTLVKKESDVWIYALCVCGSTFLGNILMWPAALRKLDKVSLSELNIFQHFKPALLLFLPSIALTVYSSIDKTLIGLLTLNHDYENGCYEQAYRIITIITTIVTILGNIMLSRNSNLVANGKNEEFKRNLMLSIEYVFFSSIILIAGTIVLAPNLSSWLFGEGYHDVPNIMFCLSPIIIMMGLSNVFGVQCLLALKKDKFYTIAVLIGTGTNICLNLLFIALWGAMGAGIASSIAEFVIVIIEIIFIKKEKIFELSLIVKSFAVKISAGIFSFFLGYYLQNYFFDYSILSFLLIGTIMVVAYYAVLLIVRDKFSFIILKHIMFWKKNK